MTVLRENRPSGRMQLAWDFVCEQVAGELNSVAQAKLREAEAVSRYLQSTLVRMPLLAPVGGLALIEPVGPLLFNPKPDNGSVWPLSLPTELTGRDVLRLPQLLGDVGVLNEQDRERFTRFHKGFVDANQDGTDKSFDIRWKEGVNEAEVQRALKAVQRLQAVADDYRRTCRAARVAGPSSSQPPG
jgi:hypothetical protein